MRYRGIKLLSDTKWGVGLSALVTVLLLAIATPGTADTDRHRTLEQLTAERQILTAELEQYRKTLAILLPGDIAPEESANPAIRKLAQESMFLKQRLVKITEQEVTLLQVQITETKAREAALAKAAAKEAKLASSPDGKASAIESKPLRIHNYSYARAREAETVERLHRLLENYYAELQVSARILPTQDELARRKRAQRDIETLAKIPFSVDKVRLDGAEGSTALAHITQRLSDPTIPESRRDIAPICSIKTRLFETLVGSESRSLRPVGKNHYIARVRLQPGDTTLSIMSERWEVRLPQQTSASDFLITLYQPPGGTSELHVFAVDDLLSLAAPHVPAWLPEELRIKARG